MITTAGTEINIPASHESISKFADDLANSVESNFVSITHPPCNSFVDDGPDLITIPPKKQH